MTKKLFRTHIKYMSGGSGWHYIAAERFDDIVGVVSKELPRSYQSVVSAEEVGEVFIEDGHS